MENDAYRVFVGNLPFDASREDVERLMARVGPVRHVNLPMDTQRKSKGYAFCEFASARLAESAARNLNDAEFQGLLTRAAAPRQLPR